MPPSKPRAQLTPAQQAIRDYMSPVARIERAAAALGIPAPVREYRFHGSRQWRFDLAWPEHRLAVEYDGGTYSRRKGGHTSISGMARDREKDAHAAILGWSVLRLDAKTIERIGPQWIKQWFEARSIAINSA